jgi:hypothetical protein
MKTNCQITGLAALAVLVGCSQEPQKVSTSNTVTAREVQERYKSAAEATKTYVTENKDEFFAAAEKKLKELDIKINDLAKKSESYTDETRADVDKNLATLREQRETAGKKFEEAKKSGAEAWKEVKAGFETVLTELEKACEEARSKFK